MRKEMNILIRSRGKTDKFVTLAYRKRSRTVKKI
jgi:hypothetical protein